MNLVTSSAITMSSREIADMLNIRHDTVKRTIGRLASDKMEGGVVVQKAVITLPPMAETAFFDSLGRTQWTTQYEIQKRDSFIVVAQLSPEFTAALVDRWQELENGQLAALPKSFADALRLAADQQEQIEQQAQQLAIAAPKVEFVDKYVEATGLKGFRQVAKLLGAKENALGEFLESQKIMYRLSGERVPYANHIDAGRFSVKTGHADNGHAFNSAKFTPKGVQWLAELWNKSGESK